MGENASVPTGREGQKPPQRPPGSPSGAIEAKPKDLPDDFKPDRDAQERAEAWFKTKFYKPKGIGEEWRQIVAAAKTWGLPDKAKWRDWLKEQWETNRAVAVKVLITAGEIEGPKLAKAEAPTELKALYEAIKARGSATLTLADIQAKIDPKATQAQLDKLLDSALIYEPKVDGGYTAVP